MASLLESLLQPISPDQFCGEDATYESEFETSKHEAEKITENNWSLLEENSKRLLLTKSKDMRILGFLCLSTALTKGLTPFAEAVQGYAKLVMEQWATIHPKRENGRANALRWLNEERVIQLLSGLANANGDYEALTLASESLKSLETFCNEKFPGGAPSFSAFAKLVRQFAEQRKPKEEVPITESEANSSTATTSSASSGPGVLNSIDDCFLSMQNIAGYLLSENPANPLGYRLSRLALWGGIQGSFSHEEGVTFFPPPLPSTVEWIQSLVQQGQWSDIVKNGEETVIGEGMSIWLDLQRHICQGLRGVGGEYAACSKVILQELAQLLARSPNLADLKFNDGTPFADNVTKEWIETDVKTSMGSGGGSAIAAVKKKGDVGEEQKQAQALFEEGKLAEALNVLRTGLANDSNQKNQFDRKLIVAELCYKGNKIRIAHAILEELREQIKHYDLDSWAPESSLEVYRLIQKTCAALLENADEVQGSILRNLSLEAHSKVSRLDVVMALQSEPSV